MCLRTHSHLTSAYFLALWCRVPFQNLSCSRNFQLFDFRLQKSPLIPALSQINRIHDVIFFFRIRLMLHAHIRGGADKSLARPASRCLRTESIVSLERGVCSCAALQVFSCYWGWKEAYQATSAFSTTSFNPSWSVEGLISTPSYTVGRKLSCRI